MARWTLANARHVVGILKYGANPAATVYDSLGDAFPFALDDGWLNLGLWEGDGGDPGEAPDAVRRLVATIASELPTGVDVLDVGNGLGVQDPLIAEVIAPRSLTAVNVTWSQLRAGAGSLADVGAHPVNADATRLPLRAASFDGLISVEAAFHFPSRRRFFDEAYRVLRPGGVLTMSDIPTLRYPRGPREALAALSQLRAWGLGRHAAASPDRIVTLVADAGFREIRTELVGDRTIGPALRFVRERVDRGGHDAPRTYGLAVRIMLSQVELLWRRGLLEYLLLRAEKPA